MNPMRRSVMLAMAKPGRAILMMALCGLLPPSTRQAVAGDFGFFHHGHGYKTMSWSSGPVTTMNLTPVATQQLTLTPVANNCCGHTLRLVPTVVGAQSMQLSGSTLSLGGQSLNLGGSTLTLG